MVTTALSLCGGTHLYRLQSNKIKMLTGHHNQLSKFKIPKTFNSRRNLAIRAECSDDSRGSGGDFVVAFLLGGAVFGTLAYIFAPQIRRSLLNEDEYGFQKAKRPAYCDDGLEKTRETLNSKISQLNSAIDNVSSHLKSSLRVRNNAVPQATEADSEMEASI